MFCEHTTKAALLFTVAFSFLLSGCAGNSAAPSSSQQRSSDIPIKFPSDFPVPLYPGAKLILVNKIDIPSGASQINVCERTKDSTANVISFYAGKLNASGWEIGRTTQTETEKYHPGLDAIKGSEMLNVAIDTGDSNADGTNVRLTRVISTGSPEQVHELWKLGQSR